MIVNEQERTKSTCMTIFASLFFFCRGDATRRPCNPNGYNSGLLHPLVITSFLPSLPFYYRLLIISNKTLNWTEYIEY